MNADGTGVSSFFAQRGWQLFAAWSPDGRRIAYSSNNDGVYKIFVITDEGGVTIISPNDSADDLLLHGLQTAGGSLSLPTATATKTSSS